MSARVTSPKEQRLLDQVNGCLFGLAIGDALGAPAGFKTRPEIERTVGPQGIRDFLPWGTFDAGSVTAGTQLTVATIRGCLRALRRSPRYGANDPVALVHEEYEHWAATQTDPLVSRVPAATNLLVLSEGVRGTPEEPINDANGNGAVVRSAATGLLFAPSHAFAMGKAFAAITHGNASGFLPAGFIAEVVAYLQHGRTLPKAVELATWELQLHDDHDHTLRAVLHSRELAAGRVTPERAIAELGLGWTGDEALAIALYCSLDAWQRFEGGERFKQGVLAAVNMTGDAGVTGALTGAILGTALGFAAIPQAWVRRVEDRTKLRTLARQVCRARLAPRMPNA